jgi:hypothetical protein
MATPRSSKTKPARSAASALIARSAQPLLAASRPRAAKKPAARAAAAAGGAAGGAATWQKLDADIPIQEQGNWCWAATSLGVHKYYDRSDNTTQCQAANLILGRNDACNNPVPAAANVPHFLDDSFNDFGNMSGSIVGGTLSFADVKGQVDAGRPLGTRIGWAGGGGHFMVIEGYRDGGTAATREVAIHDPIFGESQYVYDSYRTAYRGTTGNNWTHSYRTKSHRIRIGAARSVAGGTVTAVSRQPQLLDIFMVDTAGRVMSAASDLNWERGRWRGWWHIQGGMAQPGARVACVSRQPGTLDIFVVGTDGGIWTAAWDAAQASAKWRGWWRIGDLTAPAGARITAVARSPNHLDIFVVDTAGRVMSAAWQTGDTRWRGWWHLQGGLAQPGTYVGAVARASTKLDIFVIGTDGGTYTAAWDAAQAKGAWRGWWRVQGGAAHQGVPITAVARSVGQLDVFVIGTDRRIYTAAWDRNVANQAWRGWWPVAGGMAAHGSAVAVAARSPQHLDLAVVGLDGGLYTAAWEPTRANGTWRGWWRIGEGTAAPGSEVALVSRTINSLDGFCVGQDGFVYTCCWDAALARGTWRG